MKVREHPGAKREEPGPVPCLNATGQRQIEADRKQRIDGEAVRERIDVGGYRPADVVAPDDVIDVVGRSHYCRHQDEHVERPRQTGVVRRQFDRRGIFDVHMR